MDNVLDARLWTTIVWHAAQPADPARKINSPGAPSTPLSDLNYARPSSHHPGGANIAFCDGSARFLAEDIEYDVYCQLMTPFGDDSSDTVNRKITDEDINK